MAVDLTKYIPRDVLLKDPILKNYVLGLSGALDNVRLDIRSMEDMADPDKMPEKFLSPALSSEGWECPVDLTAEQKRKLIPNVNYIMSRIGDINVIIYTIKLLFGLDLTLSIIDSSDKWQYAVDGKSEYGLTTIYVYNKDVNVYRLEAGVEIDAATFDKIMGIIDYLRCYGIEYKIYDIEGDLEGGAMTRWVMGQSKYGTETIYIKK